VPSFPSAVKAFATRNAGDTIQPSDVNDLQDEVNAIEAGYLNGTANLNSSGSTVASLSVSGGSTFAGLVTGAAQPRCVAFNSGAQSVNSGAATALTFDSEDVNVGNLHSTAANSSRVLIPAGSSGFYWIIGQAAFTANSSGTRELDVAINGGAVASVVAFPGVISANLAMQVSWAGKLNGADAVTLLATHTVGAALNVGFAARGFANALSVVRIW